MLPRRRQVNGGSVAVAWEGGTQTLVFLYPFVTYLIMSVASSPHAFPPPPPPPLPLNCVFLCGLRLTEWPCQTVCRQGGGLPRAREWQCISSANVLISATKGRRKHSAIKVMSDLIVARREASLFHSPRSAAPVASRGSSGMLMQLSAIQCASTIWEEFCFFLPPFFHSFLLSLRLRSTN